MPFAGDGKRGCHLSSCSIAAKSFSLRAITIQSDASLPYVSSLSSSDIVVETACRQLQGRGYVRDNRTEVKMQIRHVVN